MNIFQPARRSHFGGARGFTLIELLIVIAIIAILAAILFPVFARARENARRTSCSSNLKQMGLGIMQYMQDYDEYYPFNWDYDGNTMMSNPEIEGWRYYIQPYVKSSQIFDCPSGSAPTGTGPGNIKITTPINPGGISVAFRYHYAANSNVIRRFNVTPFLPLKMSAMQRPAQMLLVADSLNNTIDTDLWTVVNAGAQVVNVGVSTVPTVVQPDGARHLGGSNILYADGHVKWLPQDRISVDPTRTNPPYTNGRHRFGIPFTVDDDRVQ